MAYTDIDKSDDYFNTVLYAGNGSTQSITGVGFQPDWTWTKGRNGTYGVSNHKLYDVVRGATKSLFGNLTLAEITQTNTLTSFDTDGFSLGNDTNVNASSTNFVAWNWLAGGTGVSNTNGSITSTVSANTTSGFSVVSYTGTGSNATVGHGLGVAPKMILVKNRNTTNSWEVFHTSMGATKVILFNRDEAEQTLSSSWNNTSPTTLVFSVGSAVSTNGSGNPLIAYCFAEKKGFSKFGSYKGNGSTNGTFVYTGFKPAWVMIKRTDSTGSWVIEDSVRSPSNSSMKVLYPNLTNAEETLNPYFDLLSNGFKIRWTSTFINASGGTYIFMAFAENPFVTSTGIPACAR